MPALIPSSLTFTEKSVENLIIKPLVFNPEASEYSSLITGVRSSTELYLTNNIGYITKRHAEGTAFTPSNGITISAKKLEVFPVKAQLSQGGVAFWNTVFQKYLASGVDASNVLGTPFADMILTVMSGQLVNDKNRQCFFADRNAENVSGGIRTGVANEHYNVYDGFWTNYIKDFYSGTISASQKLDLASSTYLNTVPVAQVATTTLTGTSGTANIPVMGINYLATWNGVDLTGTALAFKTTHEVALLIRGVVVTVSAAAVIFTSQHKGVAISVSNAVNVSGNLAGTTAATTANVAYGTLKADAAINIFKSMVEKFWANQIYQSQVAGDKSKKAAIVCSASLFANFKNSMSGVTGNEQAYTTFVEGRTIYMHDGHPIIPRYDWDNLITTDLGGQYPHRALMQLPDNAKIVTDVTSDYSRFEYLYDRISQLALFRCEYMMNTGYVYPEFVIAAY